MTINFDDFKKVELTAGRILSAERVPETDKLLKLSVDFGPNTNYEHPPAGGTKVRTEMTTPNPSLEKEGREEQPPKAAPFDKGDREIRQIISGIATYFPDPAVLVGKTCMFVTNIPLRTIKGLESNGMLLALSTDDGKFSLLEPSADIPVGTRAL
ncbi:MAG: hypothetical protein Q7R88_01655 [bacterium]|nr:hypothetical protein [bacterium]